MSKKLPDVFAVQRGTIVTDGLMSSLVETPKGVQDIPVRVIRHGIRGVLNDNENNQKGASNPQRTESAKTCEQASGLSVEFSFRTISKDKLVFSCSKADYRKEIDGFIETFFRPDVPEFREVCRRYARNILNGRWLWRNRVLGDVSVKATLIAKDATMPYCSEPIPRYEDFINYTDQEIALADNVIAAGLLGHSNVPSVHVRGEVRFGFTGVVEVFPSQNMVTTKPKGFARSLYKVDGLQRKELKRILDTANKNGEGAGEFEADMIDMGRAALRDQKIGNAIRTIDTWYPTEGKPKPIPIEPTGASIEDNEWHRKNSAGWKKLLLRVGEFRPTDTFQPDVAFLIGLLVRGGVFSEGSDK